MTITKGRVVFALLIWALTWLFSWGALMADIQSIGQENGDTTFACKEYRSQLGLTCFIGMTGPIGFMLAVFGTGFLEHGWRLSPPKCAPIQPERLRDDSR